MNTPIGQYPSYAHLQVPIAMAALAVKMSTSKTVINSALFTAKNFFPRQNFIFFLAQSSAGSCHTKKYAQWVSRLPQFLETHKKTAKILIYVLTLTRIRVVA